jgi:hypothetical protein
MPLPAQPSRPRPVEQESASHGSPWTNLSSPYAIKSTNEVITPSKWNDPNFPQQGSSSKQAAMLRFRYQIAPWMDSNNCKSTFGPTIMNLANKKEVITDCILYCAMFHDRQPRTPRDSSEACHIRRSIQDRLVREDAFTADVGRAFLVASDLFNKPISQWATPLCHHDEGVGHDQSFEDSAEPLKTLLRLQLKIGKR